MSEQTAIKSALERLREVAPLIREQSATGPLNVSGDTDPSKRGLSSLSKLGLSQPWEILLESSQRSRTDAVSGVAEAVPSSLIALADAEPCLSLQTDEMPNPADPSASRHFRSGWWLIPGLLVGLLFWGLLLRWLL